MRGSAPVSDAALWRGGDVRRRRYLCAAAAAEARAQNLARALALARDGRGARRVLGRVGVALQEAPVADPAPLLPARRPRLRGAARPRRAARARRLRVPVAEGRAGAARELQEVARVHRVREPAAGAGGGPRGSLREGRVPRRGGEATAEGERGGFACGGVVVSDAGRRCDDVPRVGAEGQARELELGQRRRWRASGGSGGTRGVLRDYFFL